MGSFGLDDWDAVSTKRKWPALLIGNGVSRAVSESFAYDSLYNVAPLTQDDMDLFDALGTRNFEEVLNHLRTAKLICEQVGHDPEDVQDRYSSIRAALISAVQDVYKRQGLLCRSALGGPWDHDVNHFVENAATVFDNGGTSSAEGIERTTRCGEHDRVSLEEHPLVRPDASHRRSTGQELSRHLGIESTRTALFVRESRGLLAECQHTLTLALTVRILSLIHI